jgi:CRISPR system Cascade subunit CasC
MRLFAEFHLIQNFAPSNLNRDDTGSPKDAIFGGFVRARVSSQCSKRAIRLYAKSQAPEASQDWGVRTKKLKRLLAEGLAKRGKTEGSEPRIEAALQAAELALDDKGLTQYLLFLGHREVAGIVDLIVQHWDALEAAASTEKGKKAKAQAKSQAPDEVVKGMTALLHGGKAIDIALFGRMLADKPGAHLDAACQVAHAISTHRIEREFDYFTAVDDEGDDDESGAGMIGTVEFNSATFYRYAVLDVPKLMTNLGEDTALALTGLRAFAEAMARAIPTGKQNSFAAHNPPGFVGVVLRHASPFNLANAFEKPVVATRECSLTQASVQRLGDYEQRVAAAFGDVRDAWGCVDLTSGWPGDLGVRHATLPALLDWLDAEVRQRLGARA